MIIFSTLCVAVEQLPYNYLQKDQSDLFFIVTQ